jgi:DNA-binding SARP family transcriptional activator
VYRDGQPLRFARKQTKELLAYLVDRRGASCTAEEIIAVLWEDAEGPRTAKQRLRNLVSDLKAVLKSVGMSEALIRQGSHLAIRTSLLDCDYYRMLEGDMAAVNAYRGEYMEQYGWAEITKGGLSFRE